MMIRYATAIRQGTASTEALLRRFQGETTHPAYWAMSEVGCAQRTIFLARWLRDRDLQHETESGLNVVENYNAVNDYIRFGKRGNWPPTGARSRSCPKDLVTTALPKEFIEHAGNLTQLSTLSPLTCQAPGSVECFAAFSVQRPIRWCHIDSPPLEVMLK